MGKFVLHLWTNGGIIDTIFFVGGDWMNRGQDFHRGLTLGIPIGLGYLSVSFAFGIYAVENGLSPLEALLISATTLTSAGQLAAVPYFQGGGGLLELAMSQVIINLRYSLMSLSISQKLEQQVSLWERLAIAFGNTDEIFAVGAGQSGALRPLFFYGLMALPWVGWSAGTLIGALAGHILPESVTSALGIAIYGMFVAIVVPEMRGSRAVTGCVFLAVAMKCLMEVLPFLSRVPEGIALICCACVASATMAVVCPLTEGGETHDPS